MANPFIPSFGKDQVKIKFSSFILLFSFLSASELEWKAEFRYRLEGNKSDSLYSSKASTINYMRSRISLKFINGPVSAQAQLQDSRYLGDLFNHSGYAYQQPDYNTFYFHQLYFQVDHLLKRNWSIKIGRFEIPLGSERLFSRNNWSNYGRSFDGIHSTTSIRFGELNVFQLFITDHFSDQNLNDDFDQKLSGLYFSTVFQLFKNINIPNFDLYYYTNNFDYKSFWNDKNSRFDRRTLGARINFNIFSHIIEWEQGIQSGKITDQDFDYLSGDIDAFFNVLNLHINVNTIPIIEKLSFGKEHFSGNDTATVALDGFANPWGAGHKYHGYFDRHTRFGDNYRSGLDEWNVKTVFSLPGELKLNIHYHNFKDGVRFDPLGTELDIVFSKKLRFDGVLQQGFARYWEENGDQLDYSWLMLTFTL